MTTEEIEKQQLAQLNQDRLKSNQENNQESEGMFQGITPATFIVIGEMVIISGAALIVDIIDLLDLTLIGAIPARLIDIPTLGVLWLWRILKQQAGPKKDPTFALLSAFLVELSPAGMIPTWTIFVLYVYFQDTKLGKKTIGTAQKLTKVKKPK